jgi:hypothetical protein
VIVLAAVVPNPPLLVPELVGGAVAETAQLRAACEAAAGRLVAAGARRWVAVAADESGPRQMPPPASGTFAGYGVDVPVALGLNPEPEPEPAAAADRLPLPLLVAGWLRERVGATEVTGELLHPSMASAECAERGHALVETARGHSRVDTAHGQALGGTARGPRALGGTARGRALGGTARGPRAPVDAASDPVGLLVLGDGASTHAAPGAGRVDERAGPFDAAVRDALATADTGALLGLDERLAAELGVTGRPGWQVLAGVAERTGTPWRAELLYSAAPYGVAYHVAVWGPET